MFTLPIKIFSSHQNVLAYVLKLKYLCTYVNLGTCILKGVHLWRHNIEINTIDRRWFFFKPNYSTNFWSIKFIDFFIIDRKYSILISTFLMIICLRNICERVTCWVIGCFSPEFRSIWIRTWKWRGWIRPETPYPSTCWIQSWAGKLNLKNDSFSLLIN